MTVAEPSVALAAAPEDLACDLCGATDYDVVFPDTLRRSLDASDFTVLGELGEHPRIVTCRKCGLTYANPRDPADALRQKYTNLDLSSYLTEESSRRHTYEKDVRVVQRFMAGGRLLDIGCSAGLFLRSLPKTFDPRGLEPGVDGFARASEALGANAVRKGTIETVDYADGEFDAVTMWDVIEHVPSPRAALDRTARWLKPGGLLFLVTPDFGSPAARLWGARWPNLIRQHLFYFNAATLGRLLETCGFDVVSRSTYTRHFTLGYLAARLRLVGPETLGGGGWMSRAGATMIPVNVGDSMFVVARRRRAEDE